MPQPPVGGRQQLRKREREEQKEFGRPLTDEERQQRVVAAQSQFQALAHQKAREFRDLIVGIHKEMCELYELMPRERKHKAERAALLEEIERFKPRVCGARAFVIDTGLQLIEGVPNNPAEPPPPPIVKHATMEEAAALAKQKAEIKASIK